MDRDKPWGIPREELWIVGSLREYQFLRSAIFAICDFCDLRFLRFAIFAIAILTAILESLIFFCDLSFSAIFILRFYCDFLDASGNSCDYKTAI